MSTVLDDSGGQLQEELNRRKHLRQLVLVADRQPGCCYGAGLCSTLRYVSELGLGEHAP